MSEARKGQRIKFEDSNGNVHIGTYKGRDCIDAKPYGYIEKTKKRYSIKRILEILG